MKTSAILFTCASAVLISTGAIAAPDPIVASDWFPLVNGAVIEFKNDAVVSSTTARVNVTSGQTFNGVSGVYSWKLSLPCDATAGKADWGTLLKSFGICFQTYERFLANAPDGLLTLGDRRQILDYGYAANRRSAFFPSNASCRPLIRKP